MEYSYFKIGLCGFVLWVVYTQVKNWYCWRALKRWGQQHGCGDMPALKNHLPGGLERYVVLFTGLKGLDILEDLVRARFKQMKATTYRSYNLFNTSMVNIVEPENIQAILATKFNDFGLGAARQGNFSEVIGNGIFTADGSPWQHYRHQLRPQFSRDQVSDLESAERHLQLLWKALPAESQAGWVEDVDLLPFLYRFTMDVSTEFLFGHSVDSQSHLLHAQDSANTTAEMKADTDFADALVYVQDIIAFRFRFQTLWWLYRPQKLQAAIKTLHDFADRFVYEALARDTSPKTVSPPANEQEKGSSSSSDKKKFVLLHELVRETRDPIEIRSQILHVLLAGRDTTAALLGWAVLLLSRHPETYASLRHSVLSTFGTLSQPRQEISFESLKACKPITQILHEALRLFPLVPMNGRVAIRDTVLPVGGGADRRQPVTIRRGEQIAFASYVLHRREDLWGADADDFRPGRWEGRKLGWDFVPFGGGPRICLGQQYALNEAGFVLVRLCQMFDVIEGLGMHGERVEGMEGIKKRLTVVLSPGDGVRLRMHRAEM